ncbi:hypothetical protein I309_02203 [Cryptococcus deuterogattii LA55]|nr:hypothetical protein I309_02203 [Cryptococcus deuterogattii LA55]KIR71265.1 hypothetical protein I310_05159 [Cryptococcus deuterogattii CA1014]KIR94555.1 hypothetical protein I304_00871 [Cryptococcus deuterogattii CBS 10090]
MAFRATLGFSHSLSRAQPVSMATIRPSHAFFTPFVPCTTGLSRSLLTSSLSTIRFPSLPPSSSISNFLTKRSFTSSTKSLIRSSYFPRGGRLGGNGYGYGGGGPQGPWAWFTRLRRRIDRIPTMTLVYGLIGINGAVFLLWQYALSSAQRFRDPSLLYFLRNNFILNEVNVFSGRIWTLVTSAFSHSNGTHIFVNCLGLYFLAPAAASIMGSASFLGLYLGAGVFSSLVSLGYHRFSQHRWWGSEGASGAIYACLAYYGALFPNSQVLLFFVIPMPVWVAIGGIFAVSLFFYLLVFRYSSSLGSPG